MYNGEYFLACRLVMCPLLSGDFCHGNLHNHQLYYTITKESHVILVHFTIMHAEIVHTLTVSRTRSLVLSLTILVIRDHIV